MAHIYHILAIITSAIWGTTFISSKLLLQEGLSPAAIMILRFVLAYVLMLPFVKGKWFCKSLKDELLMVLLGISGGSLYFLLENTALVYTQASNVAIIIAATPLLTMLTVNLLDRGKGASKRLYGYSLMSLAGVALVILNGNFVLKLNPIGDLLTFGAVVTWVIYSIIIAKVQERYSSWMITRKIFFYGVVTLLPYFLIEPWDVTWEMMSRPMVWGNIAYLGVLASLGCYMTWNIVIKRLGAVDATNYLYINPIVAMITANLLLGERITPLAIAGTALILVGVYLAERKK
ncbi:MAG: DMT family transporter [Alistipes sp.]|nr:DMT family transporter [Alistipes sp.]MBQ5860708.1 DMT family transporter [Alistipes sp.]